jgi:stage V sporulation protein SpoVS
MRAVLALICGCLMCVAIAACGGSGTSDRQQIVDLFNGMYTAMAHGDYATVCGDLTASQQATIVSGAKRAGLDVSSCAGTLTAVLKRAGITRAQLARAIGAGGANHKVDSISIRGDRATVKFTEKVNGQSYVETDAVVRQDGKWRADRILKRGQSS